MKKPLAAALLLVSFFLSLPALRARLQWERRDPVVTLCLDARELESLSPDEGMPELLGRFHAAGVRALAVYADGAEPASAVLERWAPRLPEGMALALRPLYMKLSEGGCPPSAAALAPAPDGIRPRSVLPAGEALPPPGTDAPLAGLMAASDALFPWVEFSRAPALGDLARRFPNRVVRAHAIEEEEMSRLSLPAAVSRFRRAARERGARFLYVRMFPGLDPGFQVDYLQKLSAGLKEDGFAPGLCAPRLPSAPPAGPVPAPVRQAAAFLAAVLGPWLAVSLWGKSGPWWSRPFLMTATSLASGLCAAAALSTGPALLGLDPFRGVKAALLLPLFLAGAELYPVDELRRILRAPLTVGLAVGLAGAVLAGALYLARSGNDGLVGPSGLERHLREALESFFGARPRFKEFALGHPLLWLAAALSVRGRDHRLPLLGGMVGQISLVNTFCHAHAPLSLSLLRTFHGFWVGGLIGLALAALLRRRPSTPPRPPFGARFPVPDRRTWRA